MNVCDVMVSTDIVSGSGQFFRPERDLMMGELELEVRDEAGWSSVDVVLKFESSVSSPLRTALSSTSNRETG